MFQLTDAHQLLDEFPALAGRRRQPEHDFQHPKSLSVKPIYDPANEKVCPNGTQRI
jgi:hypothetical protein